ncbi:MAG: helix-turn-helix domain-containing protein [archaeon]
MKVPCELIVWHILPSIRKEFARTLVEDLHLTQREAAKRLGVTESAVSQYLKSKRGDEIKFSKDINEKIGGSIKDISIADDNATMIKKICSVCRMIKNQGELCDMHKSHDEHLKGCNACMEESR